MYPFPSRYGQHNYPVLATPTRSDRLPVPSDEDDIEDLQPTQSSGLATASSSGSPAMLSGPKRKDCWKSATRTQTRLAPQHTPVEEEDQPPTRPINQTSCAVCRELQENMLDLQDDGTDEDFDNQLPRSAHNSKVKEIRAECVRVDVDGLLVRQLAPGTNSF